MRTLTGSGEGQTKDRGPIRSAIVDLSAGDTDLGDLFARVRWFVFFLREG